MFLAAVVAFSMGQSADSSPHSDLKLKVLGGEPGRFVTIATIIELEDKWHCYWVNPGDSGMATSIALTLPPGYKAKAPRWATPHRLVSQGLTAFGYEGRAVALIDIELPPAAKANDFLVVADGSWLVCEEACVPARQQAMLRIDRATQASLEPVDSEWIRELPVPDHGKVALSAGKTGDGYVIRVADISGVQADSFQFFPEALEVTDHGLPTAVRTARGWELLIKKSPYASKEPRVIAGVLTYRAQDRDFAHKIYLPIR